MQKTHKKYISELLAMSTVDIDDDDAFKNVELSDFESTQFEPHSG